MRLKINTITCLICSVILLISCNNRSKDIEYLKTQVEIAKRSLPSNMGTMGTFTDVTYKDDTITFVYDITSEMVQYMEYIDGEENIKENFWLRTSIDDNTKQLVNDISKAGASLKLQYNYNKKWYYRVTIPNNILLETEKHLIPYKKACIKLLQNEVEALNRQFPQKIEEGMVLTHCCFENNNFTYEYTLDNKYFDFTYLSESDKTQMKMDIYNGLNLKEDPTTLYFVNILVNLKSGLCYRYICDNKNVDILITPWELEEKTRDLESITKMIGK